MINDLLGTKSQRRVIESLKINGVEVNDGREIVDYFIDYFRDIAGTNVKT